MKDTQRDVSEFPYSVVVKLTPEMLMQLDKVAAVVEMSPGAVVRKLLGAYLSGVNGVKAAPGELNLYELIGFCMVESARERYSS